MKKFALLTVLILSGMFSFSGGFPFLGDSGINTVVIDAGHGGKDPGNLGTRRYSTTEKDIALAVSLKLGEYIKENMNHVNVVYTRKTDVFIPLKKRAEIANDAKGDIFISIHCDAFNQSSVHGSTSLILGRNHGDENRLALQENSAILMEDNYEEKYEGFDPRKPESLIALNLYQNNYLNQSVLLAKKIQDQFRERVNRRDRGVKQQPLYVTSRTAMPAVLVELGFLTNPAEEDYLNSDQGQAFMASAIFRAIRDYKVEQDKILAGQKGESSPSPIQTPEPGRQETLAQIDNNENTAPQDTPRNEVKPEASQSEIEFAVQILTSASRKALTPQNFKGVNGVEVLEEGGLYKYYIGHAQNYEAAERLKEKLKRSGFKDAFVIGLKNGRKISALEARKMLR